MRKQGNKCSVQSSGHCSCRMSPEDQRYCLINCYPLIPVAIIYITHIHTCLTILTSKALENRNLSPGKARWLIPILTDTAISCNNSAQQILRGKSSQNFMKDVNYSPKTKIERTQECLKYLGNIFNQPSSEIHQDRTDSL